MFFYDKLKAIYGAKFKRLFSSMDELSQSQNEWQSRIGKLTRAEIEAGMELLKTKLESDEFTWPNIAATIKLCKNTPAHPSHKENTLVLKNKPKPWADRQSIAKGALGKIKSLLKRNQQPETQL